MGLSVVESSCCLIFVCILDLKVNLRWKLPRDITSRSVCVRSNRDYVFVG